MSSPARAHRDRVLARRASAEAASGVKPLQHATAYELMLAKLDADRRRLKAVQSVKKKIEVKRELLPDYAGWIDGVLAGDSGVQDEVVMTVLVWRIDTEDYDGALAIADYALRHHLKLPGQYNRTLGCVLAEEFADQALRALAEKREPALEALERVDLLTAGEDMPDEVRAKLNKAIGLTLEAEQPEAAVERLRNALTLHAAVGVKKDIERIERAIRNKAGDKST
ncbi:MAG: hypothetical protein LBR05_01070 [Azoarcus sp.]|jgi:hypothetical protein|nr:hypothetical protein [Azoarcus sp.]